MSLQSAPDTMAGRQLNARRQQAQEMRSYSPENTRPQSRLKPGVAAPGPLRHRCSWLYELILVMLLIRILTGDTCFAQQSTTGDSRSMTVPELLAQQDKWDEWARQSAQLQIEGRYAGRAAQEFRFAKLPITFLPPRNNPIPEKLRSGQRIDVTGRLRTMSGRFVFDVNRLVIGETDIERLQNRAGQTTIQQIDQVYQLADEYQQIAEFYDDQPLKVEVEAVRRAAFERERQRDRMDAERLWNLTLKAQNLKLDPELTADIRFEALVTYLQTGAGDLSILLERLRQSLPGWDQSNAAWDQRREAAFQNSPVSAYQKASESERRLLHRRLFRAVESRRLSEQLKQDGSNGLKIAAELKQSIPEEKELIRQCEQAETNFRLKKVTTLNRSELVQLVDLLQEQDRSTEVPAVVDAWVREQNARYSQTGLIGIVRAADEYLFAGERWRRDEYRQQGIELLKQAWAIAVDESPADARQIADRLKRFGWERLKDQWMTTQQIQSLPDNDVQLAMREGRVVPGMGPEQVLGTLGQPAGISRIISARTIRELWVYNSRGSAGVVVHFQRTRGESSQSARVSEISPIPAQ